MKKKQRLPSNFQDSLEKYTYSSPIKLFKNEKGYQTLGGFDTVYKPPGVSSLGKDSSLQILEEQFHIEQLRHSIAGAILERLARISVIQVNNYLEGKIVWNEESYLSSIRHSYRRYFSYFEKLRTPLEHQAMCSYVIPLYITGGSTSSESPFSPLFVVPFRPNNISNIKSTSLTREKVSKLIGQVGKYLTSLHSKDRKAYQFFTSHLDNSLNDDASELTTSAYPGWWEKSLDILKIIVQRTGDLSLEQEFEIYQSFIEYISYPTYVALNPTKPFEFMSPTKLEEEAIQFDPRERFYRSLKILLEIPVSKVIRGLLNNDVTSLLIDKLKAGGIQPVCPATTLREQQKGALQILDKTSPDLPRTRDINVLTPLRANAKEEWELVEPERAFINDSSDPSMIITKDCSSGKEQYEIEISNKDVVSRQLRKELKLWRKGLNLLNDQSDSKTKRNGGVEPEKDIIFRSREFAILYLHGMSSDIFPPHRQKELAKALQVSEWPLQDRELAKRFRIPENKVKESYHFREEPRFLGIDFLAGALASLLAANHIITTGEKNLETSGISVEKVLKAFGDINSLEDLLGDEKELRKSELDDPESRDIEYSWQKLLEDLASIYSD